MTIRVRFAPSPTGYLHIGGLRTALFNYLFARHHQGKFILRIEDTDKKRYQDDAEKDIYRSLEWLGIDIDECPRSGGNYGPYRQSERLKQYHHWTTQLIKKGYAYYAFDTTEEIEWMRQKMKNSGNPSPRYDSITRMSMKNSLTLPQNIVTQYLNENKPYVIRLKIPRGEFVSFEDMIHGTIRFDTNIIDDQVLLKSDGMPTYHLANVVDDYEMKISHIIRGEEWLPSTAKHILLYKYFNWHPPKMAHLPLILSPKGGKLSKRNIQDDLLVNVRDYINMDYLPKAMINFLALLGWNPKTNEELFTLSELIKHFSVNGIQKTGAIFNPKKLDWFNEHYLKTCSINELLTSLKNNLPNNHTFTDDYLCSIIKLMVPRIKNIREITSWGHFFFEPVKVSITDIPNKLSQKTSLHLLSQCYDELKFHSTWNRNSIENIINEIVKRENVKKSTIMLPLRIAITGLKFGPDLIDTMILLGKSYILSSLKNIISCSKTK